MSEFHLAYLNLGSNIRPEINLPKALKQLSAYGEIMKVSNAWESKSVGADGPNFLNACVLFRSTFTQTELKEGIIHPIEVQLGRVRTEDKNAPRTIDIDIVLFDDQPLKKDIWEVAFIVIPLAELYPAYRNPNTSEPIRETATRLRRDVWLEARRGVFS